MDVVNAVKMIVLVWTFTSVCEASDGKNMFSERFRLAALSQSDPHRAGTRA